MTIEDSRIAREQDNARINYSIVDDRLEKWKTHEPWGGRTTGENSIQMQLTERYSATRKLLLLEAGA